MQFGGIYPTDNFTVVDALVITLISILLVFVVLIIIIIITHGINFGVNKAVATNNILPKEENKLLNEDPDAIVASLVATIDFNKETGKNAKLVSIQKIDE